MAGNSDGTEIEFVTELKDSNTKLGCPGIEIASTTGGDSGDGGVGLSCISVSPGGGGSIYSMASLFSANYGSREDGAGYASMGVSVFLPTPTEGETVTVSSLNIEADQDALTFNLQGNSPFKMTGFDVVASDLTATMTVSGTEYSIAKAIKVKIGSDTFFWPLFGPVVP